MARARHVTLTARVALAALVAASGAAAQPASYTLDPAHSFVHFEVLHFDTSTLRGRFGPLAGSVTLDRAAGQGEVGLRIPLATVNTGVPFLDTRLRGAEFLDVVAQPDAFFVATRFRFEAGQPAELRGEFTLRGIGQALSLRALRFACRTEEQRAEVCGGDFEGELLRSDFGITFGLPFIADRVRLQVQVEGRRELGRQP